MFQGNNCRVKVDYKVYMRSIKHKATLYGKSNSNFKQMLICLCIQWLYICMSSYFICSHASFILLLLKTTT